MSSDNPLLLCSIVIKDYLNSSWSRRKGDNLSRGNAVVHFSRRGMDENFGSRHPQQVCAGALDSCVRQLTRVRQPAPSGWGRKYSISNHTGSLFLLQNSGRNFSEDMLTPRCSWSVRRLPGRQVGGGGGHAHRSGGGRRRDQLRGDKLRGWRCSHARGRDVGGRVRGGAVRDSLHA